ncbi:MAG: RNHCP domain-containing protein [Clostridiales bacterium]|nr:RNHCP domain-containing protein [Clostridiales bacterium]
MKTFTKNDNGFTCQNCGKMVSPLGYTSRDHCPFCLCSLHVDITPGDRQNSCMGIMKPFDLEYSQNKGYVIVYKCSKCNKIHKNKVANDDDKILITKVANKTYKV